MLDVLHRLLDRAARLKARSNPPQRFERRQPGEECVGMKAVERRQLEEAVSVWQARLKKAQRALEVLDVDRHRPTQWTNLAARALPAPAAEVPDQQHSKWLALLSA